MLISTSLFDYRNTHVPADPAGMLTSQPSTPATSELKR